MGRSSRDFFFYAPRSIPEILHLPRAPILHTTVSIRSFLFFFSGKLQLRLPVNRFHTHFLFIIIFISLARYYPAPPPPPSRSAFFVFHAINARIFYNKYRSFLPASVNFFFFGPVFTYRFIVYGRCAI